MDLERRTCLCGNRANQVTLTMEETQGLVLRSGDYSTSPALQQADLLRSCAVSRGRQLPAGHQGGMGQWEGGGIILKSCRLPC